MFTTVAEVKELTNYDVDEALIIRAQSIIEAYVGRLEVEVPNAVDLMLLGRATAYQAVYMKDDEDKVFEQVATIQTMQYGNMITYTPDNMSPWIARLAIIACQRLSWKRIRSVRTGSIYGSLPESLNRWSTE